MSSAKQLLRHARTLYNSPSVDKKINRHNQHSWVRMVRMLGNRRLLAVPMVRRDTQCNLSN